MQMIDDSCEIVSNAIALEIERFLYCGSVLNDYDQIQWTLGMIHIFCNRSIFVRGE